MTEGFPRTLLMEPIAKRHSYFVNKVVAHPKLKATHAAVMTAIQAAGSALVVMVYGPTGVGKTTLRLRVAQQLMAAALPELEEDKGHHPVASMEVVAPALGRFNWKDYYVRALLAVNEPMVAHKCELGVSGVYRDEQGRLVVRHGVAIPKLRRALENCLKQRRLSAFIIDEAQHFQKMSSGRRLLDQMDALKSLASMTQTVHVLVGTYDLLSFANLSGQLSRRTVNIHFGRYRADSEADMVAFKNVLWTFQKHLPLAKEVQLVAQVDYLYERSAGCVGILKNWLDRAFAAALEEDATTILPRHLTQSELSTRKLLRIVQEIQMGEAQLTERAQDRQEIGHLLGMPPQPAKEPKRRNQVGKRLPQRDRVGEHV